MDTQFGDSYLDVRFDRTDAEDLAAFLGECADGREHIMDRFWNVLEKWLNTKTTA